MIYSMKPTKRSKERFFVDGKEVTYLKYLKASLREGLRTHKSWLRYMHQSIKDAETKGARK